MNERFVQETVMLAQKMVSNPQAMANASLHVGTMGVSAAQLMSRIALVRAAAAAGGQVAGWLAATGNSIVLVEAAAQIPIVTAAAAAEAAKGAALARTALAIAQAAGNTAAITEAAATVTSTAAAVVETNATVLAVTEAVASTATGAAGGAAAGGGLLASAVTVLTGVFSVAALIAAAGLVVLAQDWSEANTAEAAAARQELGLGQRRVQVPPLVDPPTGGSPTGGSKFVVIQVTNHPGKAIAVRSAEVLKAHEDEVVVIEVCRFLHGGRCENDVIETPNGPVTAGPSPSAVMSVLHRANSSEEAWKYVCSSVSNIRAASLAAGFVGDFGGSTVSIDGLSNLSQC